jgi:hypothetical protein
MMVELEWYGVTASTSTSMSGVDVLDCHGLAIIFYVVSFSKADDVRHN